MFARIFAGRFFDWFDDALLADLTPGLVILTIMGLWQAIAQWPKLRRSLVIGAGVLAIHGVSSA